MPSILRTNPWLSVGVGVGITTAAVAGAGIYYWYRNKAINTPPETWKKIGTLENITIYPIKSCGGIDLDSAQCGVLGLIYEEFVDRNFALLNSSGHLITARVYPKMLKIKPRIFKDWITVSSPGMDDLEIHLDAVEKNDMLKTNVWGSDVEVTKCGKEYDKWFSKCILGKDEGIIFVYYKYSEPTKPIVDSLKTESFLKKDTGSTHDVSSYLLINQQSIEDLNNRLTDKVSYRNFRPNFYIKTNGPPYAEDKWKWFKIGNDVMFRAVVPSYRCIFTNINPVTAERNPDGEPLKTLKTYREWGKKKSPRLGVQLGVRSLGVVKKGDDVFVESE